MKIDFIKRGAGTRLILIFTGWSTDARYYIDCVADGWDTAVVSGYSDLTMPPLPQEYSTVYIFAYSLGVWAAEYCNVPAAARIAICGTPFPVSDDYGIPEAVFIGTADGLSQRSLMKFHLRMAGDKATYEIISQSLPSAPDIDSLREELYSIASKAKSAVPECRWDKVYIADKDRIIPTPNQERYWAQHPDVVRISLHSSHAADLAAIVKDCLPDTQKIGEGFGKAITTYNENAVIQAEICARMGKILASKLGDGKKQIGSLLEIGVGNGLLTDTWRKIVVPKKADYVDLIETKHFGIADEERYFVADAEEWLKSSPDKYDIILSSSAIQWFADPVNFIKTVRSHLNEGGIAIISTFVKGNLHQLDAIRPCPLIYHSIEEYKEIPDIEIEEWESTLVFQSSREMMMHLRLTGVSPRRKPLTAPKTKEGNPHPQNRLTDLPKQLTYHPLILTMTS